MEPPLPEPPVPLNHLLSQLGPEKGRACLMSLQGLLLLMRAEYATDGNMLMALAQLEARSLALMDATTPRQRTEVLSGPPIP
jgi:hypothetical protein